MPNTSYVAIVTDQHIVEPDLTLYGLNTAASTKALVESLRKESVHLDRVVSLGDLADTANNPDRNRAVGTVESYKHARDILSELRTPLLPLPGNHDEPELMTEFFPPAWENHTHGVHHSTIGRTTLIGIDLRTGPEATGFAKAETIKTLDMVLSRSTKAIIFSHYPIFDLNNQLIDTELSTVNRADIHDVLRRHASKISASFHGHLHLWVSGHKEGLMSYGVPSSSFSFVLEPEGKGPITVGDQPCGYVLLGINDDGSVMIRPRFLPPAQRA